MMSACVPHATNVDQDRLPAQWDPRRSIEMRSKERRYSTQNKLSNVYQQIFIRRRSLSRLRNTPTLTIDNSLLNGVLLIADGSCQNIRGLLAKPQVPVLWLDKSPLDPLTAITTELKQYRQKGTPIQILHWVGHGRPGVIGQDSREITTHNLIKQHHQLTEWDIRTIALWSCSTGADQSFISLLSELTGSDVYSSHVFLGRGRNGEGNWRLTNKQGIEQTWINELRSRVPGKLVCM